MRCTKNRQIKNKVITVFACVLGLAFALSGCSSSDSSTPVTTTTVTVSGAVTSENIPEEGVSVKGIYSATESTSPVTTSATGTYTLTVDANRAVSIQFSKSGLVTLNSGKEALTANVTGAEVDIPTTAQAQALIDAAFGNIPLASVAWLAVSVEDANSDEVAGVTISSNADAQVYTDCNGNDIGATATIACPNDSRPMYLAYYNAPVEDSVSAVADTQIAPVRTGEVTFLDFEQ